MVHCAHVPCMFNAPTQDHDYMYVHVCMFMNCRIKGDAPDRFWASVEPYCADITESDLTLLKEVG